MLDTCPFKLTNYTMIHQCFVIMCGHLSLCLARYFSPLWEPPFNFLCKLCASNLLFEYDSASLLTLKPSWCISRLYVLWPFQLETNTTLEVLPTDLLTMSFELEIYLWQPLDWILPEETCTKIASTKPMNENLAIFLTEEGGLSPMGLSRVYFAESAENLFQASSRIRGIFKSLGNYTSNTFVLSVDYREENSTGRSRVWLINLKHYWLFYFKISGNSNPIQIATSKSILPFILHYAELPNAHRSFILFTQEGLWRTIIRITEQNFLVLIHKERLLFASRYVASKASHSISQVSRWNELFAPLYFCGCVKQLKLKGRVETKDNVCKYSTLKIFENSKKITMNDSTQLLWSMNFTKTQ